MGRKERDQEVCSVNYYGIVYNISTGLLHFIFHVSKVLISIDRFKDGSIVEAVMWRGKGVQRHKIVEQARRLSLISFNFVFYIEFSI